MNTFFEQILIGSKFDARGFKQAESAATKLGKTVKNLAGSVGLAFGTAQVIAYGKASVQAAAADQKAQQQLALALKNVGLGRDAASSEAYIQKLQSEFGIVDDLLRPAYQTLAVATRDTTQAQNLLNLSLDISASTGKDLGTVTAALSKAYLGNSTSLSKLGVGITKADLKTKSFEDIVSDLSKTFAGSATAAANTFQGSIDKLGVASANVKEIIGTGLIDALTTLGQDTTVADLAKNMESAALYLADVIRGIGVLGDKLKSIPVLGSIFGNLQVGMIPIIGSYIEALREAGKQFPIQKASDNQHLQSLESQFKISTKIVNNGKKLTAEELKTLKAKKLQAAIDKANLALNKGEGIFDLDKIQIAAALTNQAEQLGKATTFAQQLQIANDVARLNVKRDILDLEDAIASKDEAAITRATAKLNEDLKILGTLTGQKVTLASIESILANLKPKDLINIENLNLAIAKIQEMLRLLAQANSASTAKPAASGSLGSGIPVGDYIAPVSMKDALAASTDALLEYGAAATERANAFAYLQEQQNAFDQLALDEYIAKLGLSSSASNVDISSVVPVATAAAVQSGNRYAAQAAAQYNITNNFGVVGDPNSAAELMNQLLVDAIDRGTLRGGGY
jgi:hypothetical protein